MYLLFVYTDELCTKDDFGVSGGVNQGKYRLFKFMLTIYVCIYIHSIVNLDAVLLTD